jgi:hypothetical protein
MSLDSDILTDSPLTRSSWIWNPVAEADQYVCFRRSFSLETVEAGAYLDVSVDTDFVAYLNGVECARGQFGDFAQSKTWDRFSVGSFLRPGENTLAVVAFYKGEHFFDYQAGTAGLLLRLESGADEVLSDELWRVTPHAALRSGARARVTNQMGFTFDYDARQEVAWRDPGFDDSGWSPAHVVQRGGLGTVWTELTRRPLARLETGGLTPVRAVGQGSFVRVEEDESPARAMAASAIVAEFPWQVFANHELRAAFSAPPEDEELSKFEEYIGAPPNAGTLLAEDASGALEFRALRPGTDGRYLVLDLGEECVGWLEFSVEASAGAVLEIAHGEHLDDGRVRAFVEGRCFADRYVCREGRQHFQFPFRRLAARYLQIHASNFTSLKIHSAGLRRVDYPTQRLGGFSVADRFTTRLHEVAVRTLELCRHDHYEDCPWREQGLYAYDSRLQALYGYYAFGDYRFPEVSFDLLGRSIDESGFVGLTAPGWSEVNIPIFSFSWIVAVAEHGFFSGEPTLFRKFRPAIARMLNDAFARRDAATGLYQPPEETGSWHFYEWVPGLCGAIGRGQLHGTLHAGYNLHLHEGIRCYLDLRAQLGEEDLELTERLAQLGHDIHESFWDSSAAIYRSERTADGQLSGGHELIQALALYEGIVPALQRDQVAASLTSDQLARCSLSAIYYVLRAALDFSPASRLWVAERLGGIWEGMIFRGATTMWETENGGNDFDFAGSLCHGWTALPVWYHQAVVLGVRPLEAGFRQFSLSVYPGELRQAAGQIPTPQGLIRVAWEKTADGLVIEASGPEGCEPVLLSLEEAPVAVATYNGRVLDEAFSTSQIERSSVFRLEGQGA